MTDVDALANEIRRIDGNHDLGAGALAEKLLPFILDRDWGEDDQPVHPEHTARFEFHEGHLPPVTVGQVLEYQMNGRSDRGEIVAIEGGTVYLKPAIDPNRLAYWGLKLESSKLTGEIEAMPDGWEPTNKRDQ